MFLCTAIAGNYYEYDAIAPIADFLRTQRGFTQSQIGMLNAVFSLPNIVLALVGGLHTIAMGRRGMLDGRHLLHRLRVDRDRLPLRGQ